MTVQPGYRIPANQKACKFGSHYSDSVPVPFGSGNCSMPGFECTYGGEKPTMEICEETNKCPAYESEETTICKKHDVEYSHGDWCGLCFKEEY